MQPPFEWSVTFSIEESGASPVEEFLARVDPAAQRRLRWSIEQLRLRNAQAGMPLARHLENRLWELRAESRGGIYRLLYFFFTGRRIVFLHAFQKKTERTPRREIEVAQRRLQHFLVREGEER